LKPKRRPAAEERVGAPSTLPLGRKGGGDLIALLAPVPTPAATDSRRGAGTRKVVMHFGQRTSWPACASSAESDVRQTLHSKTIIAGAMVFPVAGFRDKR
jgi:hypothetical protein